MYSLQCYLHSSQILDVPRLGIDLTFYPVFISPVSSKREPKVEVFDEEGVGMTWVELEMALLSLVDLMGRKGWAWGSARGFDGGEGAEGGMVYVSA